MTGLSIDARMRPRCSCGRWVDCSKPRGWFKYGEHGSEEGWVCTRCVATWTPRDGLGRGPEAGYCGNAVMSTERSSTTHDGPKAGEHFYHVLIRRNSDGVERLHREEWSWFWGSPPVRDYHPNGDLFWWRDGNMACDCNREREFQCAGGEPISENLECGDTRYTVLKVILPDGREIPIDGTS